MDQFSENSLPKGWESTTLHDVIDYVIGGDWGKELDFNDPDYIEVLCIRGAEFRNWEKEKGKTSSLRKIKKSSLQNRCLFHGDILLEISGGGPEQPVGRSVLIDNDVLSFKKSIPKVCTNFIRLIRPNKNISSKFLNNYLRYFCNSSSISNFQSGSNNLRNLKFDDYIKIIIPVPPLEEQKRIATKIDELFAEIDEGIEKFLKVRKLLKAYRQSVLKHAFEGKLTEQFRARQELCIDDSKQLSQLVFKEIRQRSKVSGNYKEPDNLNLTGLPTLPKEWLYTTLGALCEIKGGLTVDAKKENEILNPIEVPYLRVANVQDGYLDFNHIKLIKTDQEKANQLLLKVGDLLFTEGGDRDKLGRGWVWDGQIEYCIHQNHIFRARPHSQEVNSKFLSYYSSVFGKAYFLREGKQTTNLASISLNKLRAFPVPLPPQAEQLEIVRIIDSLQSMISHLEKIFETEVKRSDSLRQSILKKAFLGELVSQNGGDESANTLLERIKTEKETQKSQKKKSKQRQKVTV